MMLYSHEAIHPSGNVRYLPDRRHFTVLLPLLQFLHDGLQYQRHLIAEGEFWRLWTGSLVHTNYWHLSMNLAGFWMLSLIQQHSPGKWRLLGQILFLTTCVGGGLWLLSPGVVWYVGFSGVLYGLFLLSGIHLLARREWLAASVILLGVCGKTVWDWQTGGTSPTAGLIEAPVIYAAHLTAWRADCCWASRPKPLVTPLMEAVTRLWQAFSQPATEDQWAAAHS